MDENAGPLFLKPLLHYGFALSMDDIYKLARHFDVYPDLSQYLKDADLPAFLRENQPTEQQIEAKGSVQMATQDSVLFSLQTGKPANKGGPVFPTLKIEKCLNTDKKIWVLTWRSNFQVTEQQLLDEQGFDEESLANVLANLLGGDRRALWYWDYELCGIEYVE